jgi:hypothetical protein
MPIHQPKIDTRVYVYFENGEDLAFVVSGEVPRSLIEGITGVGTLVLTDNQYVTRVIVLENTLHVDFKPFNVEVGES